VITYRVTLDVPLQLVIKVSNLLRKRRKELGTRNGTRALTCYQQAVFILAWFRDRPGLSRLGQGFGISQATAYRYKDEGVEVLRALAPTLHDTLEKVAEQGLPYLILDGTLMPLTESPQGRSSEFPTWLTLSLLRLVTDCHGPVPACRGGSLTVAAAGGTSQATSATGLRQCGQAGPAVRPSPVPACGGDGGATSVVTAAGRATSRVAALRLRRRRGLPWARCQRCLHRALQYFCRGAAGVQVNRVPQAGHSRCSGLTASSRLRSRPCGSCRRAAGGRASGRRGRRCRR
jgi:hypothetical protein